MRRHFTGLWRHPDFLKLWAGQTVSLFGSLVTRFALPLTAILALHAGAAQIALLTAAEVVPAIALGLVAGVWVDRLRRRPVMVAADVGRALALGSIPFAALVGHLRIEQLYAVALVTGILTTVFDVAYPSYLPTLIPREQLVEGNSKLQASGSVAEVSAFGLAGVLISALTAPGAILVDACSFVVSAVSVLLSRRPEPAPAPAEERTGTLRELGDGLRLVSGSAILRPIAWVAGAQSLFQSIVGVVILLFYARDLHLSPVTMGLLAAFGGCSSFVAALVVERVTRRFGVGRTLVWGLALGGFGTLLTAMAGGPMWLAVAFLVAQQLIGDGGLTVYIINSQSLLQGIAPDEMQGRLHATVRSAEWAGTLLGLIAGGVLGQVLGLRPTLLVAAVGALLVPLWLAFSPVRTLREQPVVPATGPADEAAVAV